MKKFFYLSVALIAAVLMSSCKKDVPSLNTVSFNSAIPIIKKGAAILSITSSYKGTEPVVVPVTFSGEAVKGKDYKLSTESFVLGGSKPITEIKVTYLISNSGKTVTAKLNAPKGFKVGKYPVSNFTITDKLNYKTFKTKSVAVFDVGRIFVRVVDDASKNKKVQTETKIKVKVLDESTAKEGENFEFVNGNSCVIPQGKYEGYLEIKVKGSISANNDKLVLGFEDDPRFGDGQYLKMTVKLVNYGGKWKVTSINPTKEEFTEGGFTFKDEEFKGYPVLKNEDYFTIDREKNVLIPEFKSDLKNFFVGESKITKDKILENFPSDYKGAEITAIQLFNLDNVNRNFDAASRSKEKNAYVGVIMSKDAKDDSDILKLYLLDYEPTTFLQSNYEFGIYKKGQRPAATDTYGYIVLTCKRAK